MDTNVLDHLDKRLGELNTTVKVAPTHLKMISREF